MAISLATGVAGAYLGGTISQAGLAVGAFVFLMLPMSLSVIPATLHLTENHLILRWMGVTRQVGLDKIVDVRHGTCKCIYQFECLDLRLKDDEICVIHLRRIGTEPFRAVQIKAFIDRLVERWESTRDAPSS